MKKIFVLLFALGTMTVVFAQGSRDESRDVILGQHRSVYDRDHRDNNGYYSTLEKDEQIRRINREYNWRIESVRHDRYLRSGEKRRQIRFLENEKDAKIRDVVHRYNNRNHRTNRRY